MARRLKIFFRGSPIQVGLAATMFGLLLVSPCDLWAQDTRLILSLGDDSYITWSDVESRAGAAVKRELGELPLTEFSALVLSNLSYASLPEAVRGGLQEYLARGGSVLITGGKHSFGSGGYAGTELGDLLPLRPSRDDWLVHPFGSTLILQPGHPILREVQIPTMAFFNELELNGGAVEIAQYVKTRRLPWPLIAERSLGGGALLAIALDMTLTGDWKDRDRFAQNCIEYLLQQSRIEPPQKRGELRSK